MAERSRPPRKRGRHVVLDLCSAGMSSGVVDHSRGVLLRQVLSHSQRDSGIGPAGYRLGRKASWGDLWPLFYQRQAGRLLRVKDAETVARVTGTGPRS